MFQLRIGRFFEIAIDDLRSYYLKLSVIGAVHVSHDGRRWCFVTDSRRNLVTAS